MCFSSRSASPASTSTRKLWSGSRAAAAYQRVRVHEDIVKDAALGVQKACVEALAARGRPSGATMLEVMTPWRYLAASGPATEIRRRDESRASPAAGGSGGAEEGGVLPDPAAPADIGGSDGGQQASSDQHPHSIGGS